MDRHEDKPALFDESILITYSVDIGALEQLIKACTTSFSEDYIIPYFVKGSGVLTVGLYLYLLEEGM